MEPAERSPERRARDEQIAAEPQLTPLQVPPDANPSPVESHLAHQRKNSPSNTAVGNAFEDLTLCHFRHTIPSLSRPFWLPIGHIEQKKHKFDMGSHEPKVIIECKSHTWTEGGNVPSAKLTTWDQAMLYFFLAPRSFRKLFVVKHDANPSTGESLLRYYLRTHSHVIPDEVEFWELDEEHDQFCRIVFDIAARFAQKQGISV
jgi:hypothetical protein